MFLGDLDGDGMNNLLRISDALASDMAIVAELACAWHCFNKKKQS